MKKQVGIWIDHRAALIVLIDESGETTELIESGVDKHVRLSGHARWEEGMAEDQASQFMDSLDDYYYEVISRVSNAKSLLIFGPGVAKGEIESQLIGKGLGRRIVGVETTESMTNPQIVAKVRQFYR